MKNTLLLICVLAFFTVIFVSASHAYVDTQEFGQHIEFTHEISEEMSDDDTGVLYNSSSFLIAYNEPVPLFSKPSVSFFYYINKRPPRS